MFKVVPAVHYVLLDLARSVIKKLKSNSLQGLAMSTCLSDCVPYIDRQ